MDKIYIDDITLWKFKICKEGYGDITTINKIDTRTFFNLSYFNSILNISSFYNDYL